MNKSVIRTFLVATVVPPGTAGLFSAKRDDAEEKCAALRKQREEILGRTL